MKVLFSILFFLIFITFNSNAVADTSSFTLCPLCSNDGKIICPVGFEAACADNEGEAAEPKCIFLGNKYMPGCWRFVGIKKLDLNLSGLNLPASYMIGVIGGGETYTLNREIIGCKKL